MDNNINDNLMHLDDTPIENNKNNVNLNTDSNKVYSCTNCNVKFISNNNICFNCGNVCESTNDEFNFDEFMYIIPFEKSINDLELDFMSKIKKNILLPFSLRNKNIINDVKKVYIPVILRNVNVNGKISFFAADSDIVKKNSKEYVKYEVGKTINIDYENIVYFLSSKFKDEYLSIVNNYDFNNMSLFDENLLHNSDSYFIFPDLTDINPKIENDINKYSIGMVRDSITHDLKKVKENNIVHNCLLEKKFLLPCYLLKKVINGKEYFYLMNGQNGLSIFNYSICTINIVIISVIIFILIFLISFGLSYLL